MAPPCNRNCYNSVFIGRQPIYDRNLKVIAYELLFRGGDQDQAAVVDGDQATSQVMINAFMDLGLETLVGELPAFINLTHNFLVGEIALPFSPRQVVLEVLEDVLPGPEVVAAIAALRKRGYTVALDDFVYHESQDELLALAQIVKLDLIAPGAEPLAQQIAQIRAINPTARLLAEKVETLTMFERCKALGCELFQGYFFCKPHVMCGTSLPPNRLVILNLLARLQNPDTEVADLERLLVQDVSLTYRLLRYINSAAFGLRTQIDSVRRAITLLGINTIRQWVSLILLTRIEEKPLALMVTSLVRARMCQRLAEHLRRADSERYFTTGLFSTLSAMLDRPLPELLDKLPLNEDIKQALLNGSGDMGRLLSLVIAYEQGDWAVLDHATEFEPSQLREAYLEAVGWADDSTLELIQ